MNWCSQLIKLFILSFCCLLCKQLSAQTQWPIVIETSKLKISIYKPDIEKSDQKKIQFRSAIAVCEPKNAAPVFGALWADGVLDQNLSQQMASIISTEINEIRFPDGLSVGNKNEISQKISAEFNVLKPQIALSDLSNLQQNQNDDLARANEFPLILYSSKPAVLVNIDGEPMLQNTDSKDIQIVANSPFLILKRNNIFYLSNGLLWYQCTNLKSKSWVPCPDPPSSITQLALKLMDKDEEVLADITQNKYLDIVIAFDPTELIQTDGAPSFIPVPNTNLLYVENTSDQVLLDISTQEYYTLLSGRWFKSHQLEAGWIYVTPDKLPADFAKIPEGNQKDVVLASVPGTTAALNAVRDAQIPQAAQVDRKTTSTTVEYDGTANFQAIDGTEMSYAVNSSNTVILERNQYYVVDNGVWFVGNSINGPWVVSDRRPIQINVIPPSCPVYNVRYVEIYESTPQYVYVGYTRGYLSSYVVHNTVVYGTAYRYHPWRGVRYYPRPCTWGYGMSYNPWNGWSINFNYSVGCPRGWFSYRHSHHHHHHHGWWGPPVYRPPYCVPYSHCYGPHRAHVRVPHYANGSRYHAKSRERYPSRNDIYTSNRPRPGVRPSNSNSFTRDMRPDRPGGNSYTSYGKTARPSTRPGISQPSTRPSTNQPSTRPGTSQPGTRPSTNQPSIRPGTNQPSTRPSTNQPSTRPGTSQPGTRPSTNQPSTRPSTNQPSTRPGISQPSTRPSTNQPSTQPTTRPAQPRPSVQPSSPVPRQSQPSTRPNISSRPNVQPSRPAREPSQTSNRPSQQNNANARPSR